MVREVRGLTEDEARKSRIEYGDNSISREKTKGFFKKFLENLNDPIIKVLIFALILEVVITLGKCDLFEVGGIIAAILLATTVSTASEYGSERAFLKMQEESILGKVRVLRDGIIKELSPSEIVVGDIIYLSAGEKIIADGRVISGEVRVDQSALNGESKEIKKSAGSDSIGKWDLMSKSEVFSGSLVVSGNCTVRVGRVGKNTYYGMVARDVQTETRESPLKIRLGKLASDISKIGYVMAIIVGMTYLFNTFVADNGFVMSEIIKTFKNIPFVLNVLIHALTLMITVVVVAAPEGLPMMITVVLSANMKKMMRDGVLVKKLVGIETAGSMNILFTDKTGTLTSGKPECDRFICEDGIYKSAPSIKKNEKIYRYLCLSAKYNSETVIQNGVLYGGNGTDRAISEFFKKEKTENVTVASKEEFTSERKYSSVTLSNGERLYKGAPEIILQKCSESISGENKNFDYLKWFSEYLDCAKKGERVIAIAVREKNKSTLTFIALAVLKDKVRRGVRESVEGVKRAGVRVVMMTGDGKETAVSIAQECGIITDREKDIVLTSAELSNMSDDEVKKIIPNLSVLSRALPQDKTRLVRLSQELDLVVGMTGDGINDAPSLKLADVGFSMGTGAEIAKSAGDIVILDNSFLSINRTILYGRTIFKSIRKFITFQLMMNLTACGVSFIGQFMGIDNPITIIQMLWVNIIMDTLGGLAFSGEPALEYYMKEKPKKRKEAILSGEMLHHIFFTGAYTLTLSVLFLKLDIFKKMFRYSEDEVCFLTAFYALFIFAGIFNCFGARCERMWILSNIKRNKPFALIMLFISVIQILMIYFGGELFRTVPLTAAELLKVVLLAFTVVPFEIIRRIFFKLRKVKQ